MIPGSSLEDVALDQRLPSLIAERVSRSRRDLLHRHVDHSETEGEMTGRVIQFGTFGILLSAFSCGIVGGNEFGKPVAGRTLFVKVEDFAGRIRLQITNSSNAAVSISPIEIRYL